MILTTFYLHWTVRSNSPHFLTSRSLGTPCPPASFTSLPSSWVLGSIVLNLTWTRGLAHCSSDPLWSTLWLVSPPLFPLHHAAPLLPFKCQGRRPSWTPLPPEYPHLSPGSSCHQRTLQMDASSQTSHPNTKHITALSSFFKMSDKFLQLAVFLTPSSGTNPSPGILPTFYKHAPGSLPHSWNLPWTFPFLQAQTYFLVFSSKTLPKFVHVLTAPLCSSPFNLSLNFEFPQWISCLCEWYS